MPTTFSVTNRSERLEQIFRCGGGGVTVSEFSLRYLRDEFPAQRDKFHRVFNGIETDRFPTEFVSRMGAH